MTNNSTAIEARRDFTMTPIQPVPDRAPALRVDVQNAAVTWDDILPSNYISMESLTQWLEERSAKARVLTVTGVSMELLFDPAKERAEDGDWKPCVSFAETEAMLVINKTRAQQLRKLTGSPLVQHVIGRQVALTVGVYNGKAQVGVTSVPKDFDPNQFNRDLLGI